jgi:hypothetical protein
VTQNPTGAGVGATFHPWVWPQTDLDGCHGFGRGRVFVKPASLPSLPIDEEHIAPRVTSVQIIENWRVE